MLHRSRRADLKITAPLNVSAVVVSGWKGRGDLLLNSIKIIRYSILQCENMQPQLWNHVE